MTGGPPSDKKEKLAPPGEVFKVYLTKFYRAKLTKLLL